ncbi:MAG TPA: response regulator, partial [Sphingomonadales bacterium]
MKPRILLIEDDPSLTELIRYNLEEEGFAIATSADGEEGLLLAEEDPPDLILLDWMLPNLSGIEICRRLRRNADTANLPVIMLTARAEEADRVRGLDTGADDYVTKPFSPRELVARIHA